MSEKSAGVDASGKLQDDLSKREGLKEDLLDVDVIMDQWRNDVSNGTPIRKMNAFEREVFAAAVWRAVKMFPEMRAALEVLSPFVDATAETAYTDQYARVGLSYWFFHVFPMRMKATILLHEASHVANDHFRRMHDMGVTPKRMNLTGDLEINTTLQLLPEADISIGILPEMYNLPVRKTMEIYNELVDERLEQQMSGDKDSPIEPSNDDSSQSGGAGQDSSPQDSANSDSGAGSGQGSDSGESDDGDGNSSSGEGSPHDDSTSGHSNGSGSSGSSGNADGNGNGSGQDMQDGPGSGSGMSEEELQEAYKEMQKAAIKHFHDRLQKDVEDRLKSKSEDTNKGTSGCDDLSRFREDAADKAGIERKSTSAQNNARENVRTRIVDSVNSGKYSRNGSMNELLKAVIDTMQKPVVDWREVAKKIIVKVATVMTNGRRNTTYKAVNRRYSNSSVIFPGTRDYVPSAMVGIDTSGSMSNPDYSAAVNEIDGLLKFAVRGRGRLQVFNVDTNIESSQMVKSIKDLELHGGGGTDMSVAFRYINSLSKKEIPDMFILCTDGYLGSWGWQEVMNAIQEPAAKKYASIILVTSEGGYSGVPEPLKYLAEVVNISAGFPKENG